MATKIIKFDLPMKGVKVTSLEELQDNFSADILPIFQTGRLAKWLKSRELLAQSEAIAAIDKASSELQQLAAICRVLELDDDEEVLQFLLDDRKVAQAAPPPPIATAVEVDYEDVASPIAAAVNWSGQDLSGREFIGDDLRNANLKNTNLSSANLSKANLSGSDLSGANLINVNLSEADLSGCDLSDADLTNAQLDGANLTGAILVNTNLTWTKLSKANLTNANLTSANLKNALTGESTWEPKWKTWNSPIATEYKKGNKDDDFVNFSGANLTDSNLSGSILFGLNLKNANLTRANIENSQWYNANLTNADLSFSSLEGLIFSCTDGALYMYGTFDEKSSKVNLTNTKLIGVIGFKRPANAISSDSSTVR